MRLLGNPEREDIAKVFEMKRSSKAFIIQADHFSCNLQSEAFMLTLRYYVLLHTKNLRWNHNTVLRCWRYYSPNIEQRQGSSD